MTFLEDGDWSCASGDVLVGRSAGVTGGEEIGCLRHDVFFSEPDDTLNFIAIINFAVVVFHVFEMAVTFTERVGGLCIGSISSLGRLW